MGFLTGFGNMISKSRKGTALRPGRVARVEKEVKGTHEVVRPAKVTGPVAPTAAKGSGGRKAAFVAGGAAAVAASLYGVSQRGESPGPVQGRTTGSSATSVPSKEVISAVPYHPRTKKADVGGGAKSVPATSKGTGSKGSSSGRGKTMKGKELADFLGLGADSAVRTYMETGKHKYEPRYPKK